MDYLPHLASISCWYRSDARQDEFRASQALACVAWRFWLLSNKGGRGQKNREETGAGATEKYFSRGFAARSRALRARISRAPGSTKPPYLATKTAMLRRLLKLLYCEFQKDEVMTVEGGQPKKNTQLPVIKQQNTSNSLFYSLMITSF